MSVPMSRPIGTIAFAFALLASSLLLSVLANAARAADCLAAPNSAAPANSHWYYRTDRAQQRKCWYLRAANDGAPQNMQAAHEASPNSLASFKDFMAERGTKMSDHDVEQLYTEFLAWNRRAKN